MLPVVPRNLLTAVEPVIEQSILAMTTNAQATSAKGLKFIVGAFVTSGGKRNKKSRAAVSIFYVCFSPTFHFLVDDCSLASFVNFFHDPRLFCLACACHQVLGKALLFVSHFVEGRG